MAAACEITGAVSDGLRNRNRSSDASDGSDSLRGMAREERAIPGRGSWRGGIERTSRSALDRLALCMRTALRGEKSRSRIIISYKKKKRKEKNDMK